MALNTLDQNTVSRGLEVIKWLNKNISEIGDLNVLFDASGGLKSRYTQEDLDALPGLYGMTVQQFNDAMYVVTALILPILTTNRTQLVVPANIAQYG